MHLPRTSMAGQVIPKPPHVPHHTPVSELDRGLSLLSNVPMDSSACTKVYGEGRIPSAEIGDRSPGKLIVDNSLDSGRRSPYAVLHLMELAWMRRR